MFAEGYTDKRQTDSYCGTLEVRTGTEQIRGDVRGRKERVWLKAFIGSETARSFSPSYSLRQLPFHLPSSPRDKIEVEKLQTLRYQTQLKIIAGRLR